MEIFSSKKHKFNYLEEVIVDRNFLNLHKYLKNFEFDQRAITDFNVKHKGQHLTYDFFIDKRRVRFECTKRIIKNFELYKDYCQPRLTATNTYIKISPKKDVDKNSFPLFVFEIKSITLIKEKYKGRQIERFIDTSDEYYLWIDYKDNNYFEWQDKLVKDFDKTADKLIKETIKNLKLL